MECYVNFKVNGVWWALILRGCQAMKRDMDLVRKILLALEKTTNTRGIMDYEDYDSDCSREQIDYHLNMMDQADLIVVEHIEKKMGVVLRARALTWQGHEFLDLARNECFWSRAKKKVWNVTGALPFEGLKMVLVQLMKRALE